MAQFYALQYSCLATPYDDDERLLYACWEGGLILCFAEADRDSIANALTERANAEFRFARGARTALANLEAKVRRLH